MEEPVPTSPDFTLPIAVTYCDHSGPFAIDLMVTACRMDPVSGQGPSITLTVGSGTLHDADKGSFPLDGLELSMRVARGRYEPMAILNPGILSEFQQDGLLDAISSYLNGASPPARHLGGHP